RYPRPARQRRHAVAAGDVHPAQARRPDPAQQDPHGVPEPVLALPGSGLDRRVLCRLSVGSDLMSAHDNHAQSAGGENHGSVKSYLTGFVLAAILTVIPFWVVMDGSLSSFATGAVVVVAGILQLLVHLVFFLHLD